MADARLYDETDRQPHALTKALFEGKARGRDGEAVLPKAERDIDGDDRDRALGTRPDWVKETTSNGPDASSSSEVTYSGLSISLRVLKDLQYRITFHARSFVADTVGFGFAIQVRDQNGVARGAALGPKVTAANVGEGGGTFSWPLKPDVTEYLVLQVKYSRVSGSGTGHIEAAASNKTWFTVEVVGNIV